MQNLLYSRLLACIKGLIRMSGSDIQMFKSKEQKP